MSTRVLIVDDHPVVRGALRLAIHQASPGALLSEADSLAAATARLKGDPAPDLITLDLCLPYGAGLANLVSVRRLAPASRIAIFSSLDTDDIVSSARRLGAHVFVPKTTSHPELVALIASTLGGAPVEPAPAQARNSGGDRLRQALDSLSAAQLRILIALVDGQRNSEIAGAVGVTEATVKAHLTAIYKRLGVQNRTQAVLAARPLSRG